MSLERLEALRQDMKKCVRCSLCKLVPMPAIQKTTKFTSACPPVDEYHFHAYSGGGIQVMALALLDGRIEVDDNLVQILSACTMCGACDVSCKFIMAAERLEVILALKEYIAELDPTKSKTTLKTSQPHWAEGLNLKSLPRDNSNLLLFVGSGANRNPRHAATARKFVKLLEFANIDFGILEGDEPDSGIEAYWTGQRAEFEQIAQEVAGRVNKTRVKTIVTLCGEDYGLLRAKYPHYGYTIKANVIHASEFLLSLLQKRKLKLTHSIQKQVTYHDPCYLGRQSEPIRKWDGEELQTHGVMKYFKPPKPINYGVNGAFDAPRAILHKIPGLKFVEMYRIREYAYCCGGGGGVPDNHPNVSQSAALQRIEEALDVNAELMVTSCQHCSYNLNHWQGEDNLPVIDLVDLVYESIGLD